MATINEVATRAGVSVATVSRVHSGSARVSHDTRDRVLAAAEELRYHPNGVARSLRTAVTGIFGVVLGDVRNPFFTELARAIDDEARAGGHVVVLGNADEDPERQDAYLQVLRERRIDGLLICPAPGDSRVIADLVADRTPTVLVDRDIPGVDAPVVRADSVAATRALADHLVSLGHRRIAVLAGPQSTVTGRERLTAFRDGLAEHRIELQPDDVLVGDFRQEGGERAMDQLLARPQLPSAVFAADNPMALGALRRIRSAGLRIPHDISLASFDDPAWFALADPPMTAVSQPTAELGRTAVRMLRAMVDGETVRSVTLGCRLVPRGSCGEKTYAMEDHDKEDR